MDIVTEKKCMVCGEIKPIDQFYRPKSWNYKPMPTCKNCQKKQAAHWNKLHRKKYNLNARIFRKKHANAIKKINQEYYKSHKEQIKTSNTIWKKNNWNKVLESNRKSKKAHPEQARVDDERRRARRQSASGYFTKDDIEKQRIKQKDLCFYCHRKEKLTIDHIVPLSRGGSNWPDNIVLACGSCNSKKHNKLISEWKECGRLL